YKSSYSVDISQLDHYNDYDELRLLYNCIKHDGKVNRKLSNVNGRWKYKDEIKVENKDIDRLQNGVKNWLNNILDKI
ncbi:MAG: hypothetical protein II707_08315, partial [Spirochaetales bacterium]|nr:hypothetical protein [Spirochaetales bacterium]